MNYRVFSVMIFLTLILQPVLVQSALQQTHLSPRRQSSVAEGTVSQVIPNHGRMIVSKGPGAQQVSVGFYSTEPAPMGMADYGIGPSGPYEYATNDSVGIVTIASLLTNSSSNDGSMGFQLNVNLAFNTSYGQYVYWIQDVAQFDTVSGLVVFLDNVWNYSASPYASISASGISGKGQVASYHNGYYRQYYYYDIADYSLPGNNVTLSYPATIMFNVTSGLSSSGEPTVSFAYDDGYGLITYDTVTFTGVTDLTSLIGFEVDGFNYNPSGLFYDSELILGGPGGGSNATDIESDVQLQLEYWNGHNYQTVPNAYNFGSDTAEGMDNATCTFSHYSENGTIVAEIVSGAGQLGELYNQTQTGVIDITPALASGTLYVTNASYSNAAAWQIAFIDGEVDVTLYPGYYNLQLYNQTGGLFDEGNWTISAGQTLSLQSLSAPVHEVAVTNVVLLKTVVGHGFSLGINVTVADQGDFTETFNVTVFANTTSIASQNVTLSSGESAGITFTWNTTAFTYGNYTVSAYALPVSGEINTANNNFTAGTVYVGVPGDLNGDGTVDIYDAILLAAAYGSTPGTPNWNPNADINGDGIVDIYDAIILAGNFGQHVP